MANVHPGLMRIIFIRLLFIGLWHIATLTMILQFTASVNFSNISLLWLISWIQDLMNPRFFMIAFFQFLLSSCFVLTESYQYLRVSPCNKISRFRYLFLKLSPVNILWLVVYFIRSTLAVLVFWTAFNSCFSHPYDKSDEDSRNRPTDYRVLLIFCSVWINILSFINDFVRESDFKYFSLIQMHYSSFIPTILATAKDVSIRSVYYSIGFTIFYLIFSFVFCNFICFYLFSFSANITYGSIFSIFSLFIIWLYNAFFLFNYFILKMLFDVFLTRRMEFPIVADKDTNPNEATLKDAMATINVPILRYLAYNDFNIISQFDCNRRKQIFSLSYPGGHPYTWKALSNETCKLISDTVTQLENVLSEKPLSGDREKIPEPKKYHPQIRPLSPSRYEKSLLMTEKNDDDVTSKFSNYITNIRFINYLLEEMKEKQVEAILQHYQSLSLACYSLAFFATASKKEDKFGIVQKDLSNIIHVLLKFFLSLNKLGSIINQNPNVSLSQVRKNLINVVRSSLYEISINFGQYAKDLSLSADDEKLFESFINFKS